MGIDWSTALALVGVLLGAGGLGGWLKARGENKALVAQAEDSERKADLGAQAFYRGVIEDQNRRLEAQEQRVNLLDQRIADMAREMSRVADRARRAEEEAERIHKWIDAGAPPPPPSRPPWLPPVPHREDSPWET